jgi:hypothetical protein
VLHADALDEVVVTDGAAAVLANRPIPSDAVGPASLDRQLFNCGYRRTGDWQPTGRAGGSAAPSSRGRRREPVPPRPCARQGRVIVRDVNAVKRGRYAERVANRVIGRAVSKALCCVWR